MSQSTNPELGRYLALYRSRDWKIVREEVFKIDDFECQRCFRSRKDGATLQVHHKQYLRDKKPWEYPLNLLETVCKGCHAAQHGIIPPREGWDFYAMDDLGDLVGNCDYCNQAIRYVYSVGHENWHVMEVGTVCCDKLTNTDLASTDERHRRNFNDRKKKFISSPKWIASKVCYERRKDKGVIFEILKNDGVFRLQVNRVAGRKLFASAIEAKSFAFDWKAGDPKSFKNFLDKHPLPWSEK
jgi:hypothetical protein